MPTCTARSISASASTINASAPPSSSRLFFSAFPAAAATAEPARVLPVTVTAAILASSMMVAILSVPAFRVANRCLGNPLASNASCSA